LPHVNPGVMTANDLARLRTVSVSAGLMLESSAERLSERGGPHHGCPDKLASSRYRSPAAFWLGLARPDWNELNRF
jgi:FO synthase